MMLHTRILFRSSLCLPRPSTVSRAWRARSICRPIRWKSSSPDIASRDAASRKYIFPERLIVYHAGTGRSVFLGCLKVTTIFIFSFFCLVVAPTHWYAEEDQKWIAAGVMASGIIPVVFVAYISSPFVAHVHLQLPHYARQSRDILKRYSQNLPKDAKLEITTMNMVGKPRLSLVKVKDLHPVRERFGMVNYVRDTKEINSKRPWYMGRAVRQFSLPGAVEMKGSPGVWENIIRSINKP